ncbi:MAG: hypothetical protein ACE5D7_09495 [Fidelibacterota bacterium]
MKQVWPSSKLGWSPTPASKLRRAEPVVPFLFRQGRHPDPGMIDKDSSTTTVIGVVFSISGS